jgi:hypothetical protein
VIWVRQKRHAFFQGAIKTSVRPQQSCGLYCTAEEYPRENFSTVTLTSRTPREIPQMTDTAGNSEHTHHIKHKESLS